MSNVNETLNQPESASSADSSPATEAAIQQPLEANPAPQAAQAPEPSNDAKDSAVESSTTDDKDANKKATLLDVVKAAYEKDKPDSNSSDEGDHSATADSSDSDAKLVQDDSKQKDNSNQQAEKLPFHNHPRWKEMISEREALKPRAEQYDKITNFMHTNGLTPDEMAEGMHVMALMKQNPVDAYKQLQGYIEKLAPYTGEVLPPEIKAKVDEGFVDEETAKELAMLKAQRDLSESRQRQADEQRQQQEIMNRQRSIHDAVANWEQIEKAKDPDWSAKYEMVMERVNTLLVGNRPQSPDQAIEIARRALSDVNARLRPLAGRNNTIKTPTSSLSSNQARSAPRSLDEVIRMGLQSNR
jgi:hypothetical protein